MMLPMLTITCFLLVSASVAAMPTTVPEPLATSTTKPACQHQCGNLTVPYPFGIGSASGCYKDPTFEIICNTSYSPPKAFLPGPNSTEVFNISETQLRVKTSVATLCSASKFAVVTLSFSFWYPYSLASDTNELYVIGCHAVGNITGSGTSSLCLSECVSKEDVDPSCGSRHGCCQTPVSADLNPSSIILMADGSRDSVNTTLNPCLYAFVGEIGWFEFHGVPDLDDPTFPKKVADSVPVVLDWVVQDISCDRAKKNLSSFACQANSDCNDADTAAVAGGYRCICLSGYRGNPYLSPGCSDVNECADPKTSPCSHKCRDTQGSYRCFCPSGYLGDGLKNGSGCLRGASKFRSTTFVLSMCFGFVALFIGMIGLWLMARKRRLMARKEKFFKQNGGLLLKQLSSTTSESMEATATFREEELRLATNNFSEEFILGKGGYSTVYKGLLSDGREVAIKRSKIVDEDQIDQFINELFILSRINHRNVVKLLGCCLETEVPLLVYEFISNGTLYEHIHAENGVSWLSWNNCLRIAVEIADALAYMHSAASVPIIHRDIKSANILLDNTYMAKISDFGASRLIPLDQTQLCTAVQGTLGYLDPEYFFSSKLTEKSDVYSFGVVLVELLTRETPVALAKKMENRIVSSYFLVSPQEDHLFDLIVPQLAKDASREQLVAFVDLIRKCVSVKGEDRPTMREVATHLEQLRSQRSSDDGISGNAGTGSSSDEERDLFPVPDIEANLGDLYPIPDIQANIGDDFEHQRLLKGKIVDTSFANP